MKLIIPKVRVVEWEISLQKSKKLEILQVEGWDLDLYLGDSSWDELDVAIVHTVRSNRFRNRH